MVFDVVEVKENEGFVEEMELVVGVEEVVVVRGRIVGLKEVEEIVYVKMVLGEVVVLKVWGVMMGEKVVEGVEGGG